MKNKNRIYHVVSLKELRALVAQAERESRERGDTPEEAGSCCLILRGELATGRHSISRVDGSRQVSRLTTREISPEYFAARDR